MNISAGPGVAIREFPLSTGEADYLLYTDAKAIGVVEAKPEGHSLTGVETQSGKYLDGLPANLPNYRLPLPFVYESRRHGSALRGVNLRGLWTTLLCSASRRGRSSVWPTYRRPVDSLINT
jgi:hypothetical protein